MIKKDKCFTSIRMKYLTNNPARCKYASYILHMTKEEALDKMQRYCAYQDRCHQEVRSKLLSLKIYGDWLEEIMTELIKEGYLNEERFARNYARGKFRIKGWGKQRITRELKSRAISDYCIRKAMEEVDEEGGYEDQLRQHLQKYYESRKEKYAAPLLRKKLYAHGIAKGYESVLINQIIESLLFSPDRHDT